MSKLLRHSVFGGAALFSLLASCGGRIEDDATSHGYLDRAASCDDLLRRLQEDAVAKLDAQLSNYRLGYVVPGVGVVAKDDGSDSSFGAGGASSNPPVTPNSPTDQAGEENGPHSYSTTNNQVAGVDEADFVKTDGQHLYLLHGTDLYILASWPAEQTRIVSRVTLEGTPTEMFVDGSRALVYSNVADPVPAEAKVCGDCGSYWSGPAVEPMMPGYPSEAYTFTKLTVLDLAAAPPTTLTETYLEGSYSTARLQGSTARGILAGGYLTPVSTYPAVSPYDLTTGATVSESEFDERLAQWRDRQVAAIAATELQDWLPRTYQRTASGLVRDPFSCTDYYVPRPGLSGDGITTIASMDLLAVQPTLTSTAILGYAQEVYANEETLLLAQSDWQSGMTADSSSRTILHAFGVTGEEPTWLGSGVVNGTLHDQFSLDERDGITRVATTEEHWSSNGTPERTNRVSTLEVSGGALKVLGQSAPFADGEQIYSTRFVGDTAYVVTFRQVDPLFAIDLSNPAEPRILGSLEISGFSDYMHPLDDHHLLTIGREVDPTTGWANGLMLQIFDVTTPTAPQQSAKYVFSGDGWSAANEDHKAFTYFADKGLLAFPYVDYSSSFSSTLQVFGVTPDTGINYLGAVDQTRLFPTTCLDPTGGYWNCDYLPEVRRGVFIEDYLYAISYGAVTVQAVNALATPVASVQLPEPLLSYDMGYADGGLAVPANAVP